MLQSVVSSLTIGHIDATELDTSTVDDRLLREIAEGHNEHAPNAFRQLYDRHATALLAFCATRIGRTQADDVSQAVWMRLWPHLRIGKYHRRQFRPLLFTTARNIVIDEFRRRRPKVVEPASDGFDQVANPIDDTAAANYAEAEAERMRRLSDCIEKLEAAAQPEPGHEDDPRLWFRYNQGVVPLALQSVDAAAWSAIREVPSGDEIPGLPLTLQ